MSNLDPVVAKIEITFLASGALSVSGNIADTNLALALLDHAKDAVRGQAKAKDRLLIPMRDVQVPAPIFQLAEA